MLKRFATLSLAGLGFSGCGGKESPTVDKPPTIRIHAHTATPQIVHVADGNVALRFRSGDGQKHSLLIPVDNGYRAEVPVHGTTTMKLHLPPGGTYPFVIDQVQGPKTFVLVIDG